MSVLTKQVCDLDYLAQVRRFPLRRITSAAAHRQAVAIITELSTKGDARLSNGEVDYLEALGRFVADYERKKLLADLREATPLEVLRHLMEERGMTPADLGDVLGSRPASTMILKGQREMSKAHIRAAAAFFAVSPAVFL
jgi:antitoxin component HigA of HigAB toxin-antitoxin module